jgi:hypothetical protein
MSVDQNCRFDPGAMVPIIDPMGWEAEGPCVPACPYDVLIVRKLLPEDKAVLRLWVALNFLSTAANGRSRCILKLAAVVGFARRRARRRL